MRFTFYTPQYTYPIFLIFQSIVIIFPFTLESTFASLPPELEPLTPLCPEHPLCESLFDWLIERQYLIGAPLRASLSHREVVKVVAIRLHARNQRQTHLGDVINEFFTSCQLMVCSHPKRRGPNRCQVLFGNATLTD